MIELSIKDILILEYVCGSPYAHYYPGHVEISQFVKAVNVDFGGENVCEESEVFVGYGSWEFDKKHHEHRTMILHSKPTKDSFKVMYFAD